MAGPHTYETVVTWTGNAGTGTSGYKEYSREHEVAAAGRPAIPGTADPAFRGDPNRWNPEQLLIAALSQCHMLWYLHLCADAGVVVTGYVDRAAGTMTADDNGGRFAEVVLRPSVTVASDTMVAVASRLHDDAHRACYIANSVRFPVRHEATINT